MENEHIIHLLKKCITLKKEPVALKAWKEEPQGIPKYQGNAFPGMCTQISEVLAGKTSFYTNQEHCFCTGGIVATGVAPALAPEDKREMIEVHNSISKGYQDIDTAMHYEDALDTINPAVPESNAAVQVGLLQDIPQPDVVLLFCTPGTADIINRTYCYVVGEPIQGYGGNGGCPFLIQIPFTGSKPSFSYSDVAWRKYIGLGDDELTMSFPYKSLEKFIDFLPEISEAYRRYGDVPEE